jgi:hypothetical protein
MERFGERPGYSRQKEGSLSPLALSRAGRFLENAARSAPLPYLAEATGHVSTSGPMNLCR